MWIILPLIYFMSWKSYRRFGQAFSETAAWVLGYLGATGILLALHFGGVGMISATPDDPMAVVAILGGFVGMAISRYLWKRRGGHLEPVNNPLTNSRYFRAARAMILPDKNRRATKPRQPVQSQVRSTSTSARTSKPTTTTTRPATQRRTTGNGKSSAQKWGRVLGAMLTPSDQQRRPPRQG